MNRVNIYRAFKYHISWRSKCPTYFKSSPNTRVFFSELHSKRSIETLVESAARVCLPVRWCIWVINLRRKKSTIQFNQECIGVSEVSVHRVLCDVVYCVRVCSCVEDWTIYASGAHRPWNYADLDTRIIHPAGASPMAVHCTRPASALINQGDKTLIDLAEGNISLTLSD